MDEATVGPAGARRVAELQMAWVQGVAFDRSGCMASPALRDASSTDNPLPGNGIGSRGGEASWRATVRDRCATAGTRRRLAPMVR
jgi:hypothetical protein